MKLHLPVHLFHAVMLLMAVSAGTLCASEASSDSSRDFVITEPYRADSYDGSSIISGYNKVSVENINVLNLPDDGNVVMDCHPAHITGNKTVVISGNSGDYCIASGWRSSESDPAISLSSNDVVKVSGNYSLSKIWGGGALTTYRPAGNYEGASYIEIANNKEKVEFIGNVCEAVVTVYSSQAASGGAISAYGGLNIDCNKGTVDFRENRVICNSSDGLKQDISEWFMGGGGAIFSLGSLNIRNNEKVVFEKNVEIVEGVYRLRGVISNSDAYLSSASGNIIEFRDSANFHYNQEVSHELSLNADYVEAENTVHKQQGDILFTGEYTEKHLNEILEADGVDRKATAEEILASRTTLASHTSIYGGRLRVEEGAVYQGQGITVMEGSAATVRVKDATLSHAGYDLVFNAGTTLELEGNNVISGNVQMKAGSKLTFIFNETQNAHAPMTLSGDLSLENGAVLQLCGYEEYSGALEVFSLAEGTLQGWDESGVRLMDETGSSLDYDKLQWVGQTLYYINRDMGTLYVTWTNAASDGKWNNRSLNWVEAGQRHAVTHGANVIFDGQGEDTIEISRDIQVRSMQVTNSSRYEIQYADNASMDITGTLQVDKGSSLTFGGSVSAGAVENAGSLAVQGDMEVLGAVSGGGALTVQGALSATSLNAAGLSAASLILTDSSATNMIEGDVTLSGAATVAGSMEVEGSFTSATLQVKELTAAGSISTGKLTGNNSTLTAQNGSISLTNEHESLNGNDNTLKATGGDVNLTDDMLGSRNSITATSANGQGGNIISAKKWTTIKGGNNVLTAAGAIQLEGIAANGEIKGDKNILKAGSSIWLTNGKKEAHCGVVGSGNVIEAGTDITTGVVSGDANILTAKNGSIAITGAIASAGDASAAGAQEKGNTLVAGGNIAAASIAGDCNTLTAGGNISLGAVSGDYNTLSAENGSITAASITGLGNVVMAGSLQVSGGLEGTSLTLTDASAVNNIGGAVSLRGAASVAGALTVGGALTADSLASSGAVVLTGAGAVHAIEGDMTATSVDLSGYLSVGGSLNIGNVTIQQLNAESPVLTVGSFVSGNILFALNGDALSGLNLGHGESVTIATSDAALADGFKALMANGTEKMTVTVYDYIISQNANNVVVTADYANWGTRVWYEGAWVGDESWSDMLIGGYSVTDGVERVDLQGDVLETENLFIAPGSSCSSVVITNGEIYADYAELADASLTIGTGATLSVYEFLAEEKEVLLQGTLDVSNASIGALSGTTGSLSIQTDGVVTVGSNVTLGSFSSDGVLDIGSHTLNVAGGVSRAGSVIAGEVKVHNSGRNAVQFDTLIADKVTVTNRLSSSSYSDDISVGGGSAIGELVAETMELRDGSMQLGRADKATSQSLQKLKLAAGTGMELNENTALTVTGTLDAGANTTVSMKQGSSLSYGDVRISNKRSDATASVTAKELAAGTGAVVTNAHASFAATAEKSVDFLFAASSVENAGSALLTLTNSGSTLTGLHATGGNVDVLALGDVTLNQLEISTGKTIAAAAVTVTELAKLADGAKLAGNLTLASGATVELGGTLTLEGALNLQTGLTLSGTVLETIAGLEEGQSHILFSGVTELNVQESMTLNNMRSLVARTQETASYRGLMDGQQVAAGDYFSNLAGNSGLVLSYNSESGTVSISHTQAIPEPATATLSLLALAALAARRRRK